MTNGGSKLQRFISLVKKELYTFKFWWISLILLVFIFIGLLPPIMEHFLGSELSSGDMRIVFIFISMLLFFIIPILQLHASLNNDIKQKDIWLHHPSKMFTLIGAKWVYVLITLFFTSLFCFSGFFFLGDNLVGTWKQIFLLIILSTFLEVFCYVIFSNLFLLFFALYLQIKRYIGHFSMLITFTLIILFFWFLRVVPEKYIQFPYGKIPTDWIYDHLPTFKKSEIFIKINFYSVDLIVDSIILIICYIIACKWIEKVITR